MVTPQSNGEYYFEGDEFFNPRLQLDPSEKKTRVEQLLSPYRLSVDQIGKLRGLLNEELQLGLQATPTRPSVFPMVNTFVTKFPSGTEVGDFLGLDIGGTNLRILHLKLTKNGEKYEKAIELEFYDVPKEVRLGTVEQFFGFLAKCIATFVDNKNLKSLGIKIPMGFTFSFGYEQYAIDKGEIVQMGIATSVQDVKGKDPVLLLQQAIDSLATPVRVVALANDTTATLVYAAYLDHETTAGLILGSGTNVAYIEKIENFGKISDPLKTFGYAVDKFVVNSEFPLFGDNGGMDFAKNKYDHELDNSSLTPHIYTYEKITGGAYLGDLLRYTLIDLVRNGLLLGGQVSEKLTTEGSLPSAAISAFEAEFGQNGSNARKNQKAVELLEQLGYSKAQISEDDSAILLYAGQLITVRSAIFIASAVSVFVDHLKQNGTSLVKVGCDGSLFKKHPKMSELINRYANKLAPNSKTEVFSADQGSGIGVAMIAATVASNQ